MYLNTDHLVIITQNNSPKLLVTMELLNKTIKKLSEQEYQELLSAVAGRKNNKPYTVLEYARKFNYSEDQMMDLLAVNPSTYYTLKSRLNEKIAQYMSKNVHNPINALKEKVATVPAMMFGNNREVAIRALRNLEKQLIEYDLSTELITVYKALARLSMFNGDFDFYEKEYNKHVAYSLAVVKAEDLFYEFAKRAGKYLLSKEDSDKEMMSAALREITNIAELYHGHRLFVLSNVVRLYHLCIITSRTENLKALELEVDSVLGQIDRHFSTYELDTFYQSIRFLVDLMYFEYYQQADNQVRADHHFEKVNHKIGDVGSKPIFNFYSIQFLFSKVRRYLSNKNINQLLENNGTLEHSFDAESTEPFAFISFKKYIAICKFYQGDFANAAKTINSLRNEMSIKKFLYADVEVKLFQALQYCVIGDDSLCNQILQSVKRQIPEHDEKYEPATILIKMIKTALKPDDIRRKIKKLTEINEVFEGSKKNANSMFWFLQLDENILRKMANPIKN